MRLSQAERKAIKKAVENNFGPEAKIFLFGSRIDDSKRGGDIDLYIETCLWGKELIRAKLMAMVDIQRSIGDRKIDIVTYQPEVSGNIPAIVKKARDTGVDI